MKSIPNEVISLFKPLSKRTNPEPPPNVLVTDEATEVFRNQLLHVTGHLFYNPNLINQTDAVAKEICSTFMLIKGRPPYPPDQWKFTPIIGSAISNLGPMDLFDFIDLMCHVVHKNPFTSCLYDDFESELNDILKLNSIGYRAVEGQLIPIVEEKMTDEVIIPAFRVLALYNLDIASNYLSEAFRFYKDGDNESAVTSAFKALESTINTILNVKGIEYDKRSSTSFKIDLLAKNNLLPSELQSSTSALCNLMKGTCSIRNNMSGHGSAESHEIIDAIVIYEIDMVASTILFLVRASMDSKKGKMFIKGL